jgi:hypothetical protein
MLLCSDLGDKKDAAVNAAGEGDICVLYVGVVSTHVGEGVVFAIGSGGDLPATINAAPISTWNIVLLVKRKERQEFICYINLMGDPQSGMGVKVWPPRECFQIVSLSSTLEVRKRSSCSMRPAWNLNSRFKALTNSTNDSTNTAWPRWTLRWR